MVESIVVVNKHARLYPAALQGNKLWWDRICLVLLPMPTCEIDRSHKNSMDFCLHSLQGLMVYCKSDRQQGDPTRHGFEFIHLDAGQGAYREPYTECASSRLCPYSKS